MNAREDSAAKTCAELILQQGQGRSFAILFDEDCYQTEACTLAASIAVKASAFVFRFPRIDENNWQDLSTNLLMQFAEHKIRQVSIISFGSASAVAQHLALTDIKLVRSLVLINASCRPHPNWRDRLIDRIESILPLGLPFRLSTAGFDSKPFLQRIRCPVLVLLTIKDAYLEKQAELLAGSLPTAWRINLQQETEHTLADLILNFQDVPVKCPQKSKRAA